MKEEATYAQMATISLMLQDDDARKKLELLMLPRIKQVTIVFGGQKFTVRKQDMPTS